MPYGLVGAEEHSDLTEKLDISSSSDYFQDFNIDVATVTEGQLIYLGETLTICWPIDTGASSLMTDQVNQFRGFLKRVKVKRVILIGGGIS